MTIALDAVAPPHDRRAVWIGRALSGLAILFLASDAAEKLVAPDLMIANSPPLGLPAEAGFHRLLGAIFAARRFTLGRAPACSARCC